MEWNFGCNHMHGFKIKRMWVQFEIKSMISDQNCSTWGSITTLLHPFKNRPKTGLGQFLYFIDAVLSWFEIKFIHFLGGKIRVLESFVFGVTCSLAGKRCDLKQKMVQFVNKLYQLEPIRLQRTLVISKRV